MTTSSARPRRARKGPDGVREFDSSDIARDEQVYIVDDDSAVRSALALLARSCGWSVFPFASAEDFLAAVEPGEDRCLVLDLDMPGMNGAELCEHLDTTAANLPVVILTAHQNTPMAKRATDAGALAVLPKPVDSEQLLTLIAGVFAAGR